jgi:hypothetical protein
MISGSRVIRENFRVQSAQAGSSYTISGTIRRVEDSFRVTLILSDTKSKRKISEASIEYRDIVEVPASIPYLSRQLAGGLKPALLAGNIPPKRAELPGRAEIPPAPAQAVQVPAVEKPPRPKAPEKPAQPVEEKPEKSQEELDALNAWKNKPFYAGLATGFPLGGQDKAEYAFNINAFLDWQVWKYAALRGELSIDTYTYHAYGYFADWGQINDLVLSIGVFPGIKLGIFDLGLFFGVSYFVGLNLGGKGYQRIPGSIYAVMVNPQIGVKLGPGVLFLEYRRLIFFAVSPTVGYLIEGDGALNNGGAGSSAIGIGYKLGFGTKNK